MVGLFVVIGAAILNIFMNIPALFLAVNVVVVMIMSGFILFETSRIVNGGETNYIMATASLFLSLLNMFQALMHLLGAFGGDD
jgi:modulator of FtsH protease